MMRCSNCPFTQINGQFFFASVCLRNNSDISDSDAAVAHQNSIGSMIFLIKTLCTYGIRWIDPKSKGSENLAMACDFLPRSFRSHDIKRPDDDFDDAEDDDTAPVVMDSGTRNSGFGF